jgi:4-hydroxy-2-oxoheptanedioate aldolase
MIPAKRPNAALRKLQAGEMVRLYVMGNFASPRHVDFICQSEQFDALWFDLEHFDLSTQDVVMLNFVSRAYPVTTIARLRAADYQGVMRILEAGVGGIMCSMVKDAAEARQIVQWAKFHDPHGSAGASTGARGWNGGNVDSAYGNIPAVEYLRHQNAETMVICQIETEAAVAQAAEIAAVPGVDGLFFGPGDYSAALGVAGQLSHPEVVAATEMVAKAAQSAGKWWGTVAVGAEMRARVMAQGALLICPGGDVRVMNLGLKELLKTFA